MGRASRAWAILLIAVIVLAGIAMAAWTQSPGYLLLPLGPLILVPIAFQGIPLQFDEAADYVEFLRGLQTA